MKVLDLLFGSQHSFLERSAFTTIEVGLRYFLFAGVAWLLGYWIFRNRWFHRKIITRFPVSADVRREIGYSSLTLVIFGVMGAMAAMMSDNAGLVGLLMVVAGLLFVALIIWVVVRLSLALPITVAERRIAIFDSWKLTKGHFWGLLGMAILAWVLCLVVQILLSIVLMPILFAVSGGFENLAAIETMQPMEILQTMAPMAITILVFAAIVSALQLAIMYAPFASAYMGLTGRGGDAPEPAVSTEL